MGRNERIGKNSAVRYLNEDLMGIIFDYTIPFSTSSRATATLPTTTKGAVKEMEMYNWGSDLSSSLPSHCHLPEATSRVEGEASWVDYY